jgi:hypothetical protein
MADNPTTTGSDEPIRHDLIRACLEGRAETTCLTEAEDAIWLEAFTELMDKPSAKEIAFFEEMRRRGGGVGVDENGKLVWGKPEDQT